jgi:hypothetical protein
MEEHRPEFGFGYEHPPTTSMSLATADTYFLRQKRKSLRFWRSGRRR